MSRQQRRVVGVLRLSVETDESTSIQKQKDIITAWAAVHGYVIVGWAIDEGVSGATSPFEREGLREWLTEERCVNYDILVGWKIDRFGRKTREFLQLVDWLHSRGKDIAVTDINIDTTTPGGKMIITILSALAEWERSMIADRVASTHQHLRKQGRLSSGKGPWWTKAVQKDTGYYLELIPDRVRWLREHVIEPRLAGESINRIAKSIDYSPARVNALLMPERLIGWRVYTPRGEKRSVQRVERDSSGEPVQYCAPVISDAEYHELKSLQSGRSEVYGSTARLMLRGLLACGDCGRNMVKGISTSRGVRYLHYKHATHECGKGRFGIAVPRLDQIVSGVFLDALGDAPRVRRVFVPGNDVSEELTRVNRNIEGLREESEAGLYDDDREGYLSRLRRLTDRRRELVAAEATTDRWEMQPTGDTYGEWWGTASDEERNRALAALDLRALVYVQDEAPKPPEAVSGHDRTLLVPIPTPAGSKAKWLYVSWTDPVTS